MKNKRTRNLVIGGVGTILGIGVGYVLYKEIKGFYNNMKFLATIDPNSDFGDFIEEDEVKYHTIYTVPLNNEENKKVK